MERGLIVVPIGPLQSNMYIITGESGIFIIDPSVSLEATEDYLREITITSNMLKSGTRLIPGQRSSSAAKIRSSLRVPTGIALTWKARKLFTALNIRI